ncbi:hypothetical protein ACOMHN_034011 [Nucella lapillus]
MGEGKAKQLTKRGERLQFWYSFDNFTSLDPNLLYPPLLGIPTRGLIPAQPTALPACLDLDENETEKSEIESVDESDAPQPDGKFIIMMT